MAAPTNVRVYATSQTTAVLKWTYSGSGYISVHRSTDGSAYSEITDSSTRVAPGTTSYTDTTLSAATKYWYKLSDDSGSTFSSVVTVYGHSCLEPAGGDDTFALPRTGGETPGEEFDEMAERIEAALNGRVLNPEQCVACPDDGAITIDCSGGCHDWVVIADEDINSIGVQWCEGGEGSIEFIIPPNTTNRRICGWPAAFGFDGDECFQAPLSTGSDGRSISVGMGGAKSDPGKTRSRPGYSPGAGRGGGTGTGCNCVPTRGQLTIKSCNPNNSLKCSTTKSLTLIACGGRPPYTWSNTGTVQRNKSAGDTIKVTPPTNSGSGVSGDAYYVQALACGVCSGSNCTSNGPPITAVYQCNDALNTCVNTQAACGSNAGKVNGDFGCCPNNCGDPASSCPSFSEGGASSYFMATCDVRTAGMISDGCNPCGVAAAASTVTVTDSVGTEVTITLRP